MKHSTNYVKQNRIYEISDSEGSEDVNYGL